MKDIVQVAVRKDLRARLLEAWDFGQFADDFDQALAKRIRADIRIFCESLAGAECAETSQMGEVSALAEAQNRLFDVLRGDDGQAYKEAERYLERERPDLYAALSQHTETKQ